ncbi:MAG: BatD family protein [Candidatus Syntrophosphaera sp.]|nr:BatD family protein [Candidatus Syntrophosphaera sp.]
MVVRKFWLILFLLLAAGLQAQSVKVSSSVQKSVISMSEQLQLKLEISSDKYLRLSAPTAPHVPGLAYRNMLSSSSSQVSIVNRASTRLHKFVYTYYYSPQRTGTFTLPGFKVSIDKRDYSTQPITIEVVDAAYIPPQQYNQDPYFDPYVGDYFSRNRNTGISLLLCLPERQSVYLGEPAIVAYYLYTNQMVESFYTETERDYEGYGKSSFEQPKNLAYEEVIYNGERFQRALIKKTALYPQVAGRLQAPTLSGKVQFTGIYSFLNKTVGSSNAWIDVKPLPAGKPAGFTGAVGDFEISQSYSADKVSLGEALTSTVRINGRGNFSQFTAAPHPQIENFQISEPTLQDRLSSAVEGTRNIIFTILPQSTGDHAIPGYTFSWFDTSSGAYRTFTGPGHDLSVRPANVLSYFSELLQGDKPKTLNPLIVRANYPDFRAYGSRLWFWLVLAACALSLAVSGFLAYERRLSRLDPAAYDQKTASRILNKYLRQATQAAEGFSREFHPLAENGLMNFLARKYAVSKSLSTPELLAELRGKAIPEALVRQLEEFLLLCQQARYMPGGAESASLSDALAKLKLLVQGFSRLRNGHGTAGKLKTLIIRGKKGSDTKEGRPQ